MLAITSDVLVVALGGILTAIITAGLAFAGVIVSVRAQKTPIAIVPNGLLEDLKASNAVLERRVLELEVDRDHWRELAVACLNRHTLGPG